MSITLTLHKYNPSKITYKLYIEDSYICLLNQFPSPEFIEHMIFDNSTEYEWSKWIKLAYSDAFIYLNFSHNLKKHSIDIFPINDIIKYNVLKSIIEYSNDACFKVEAFENRKAYGADLTCYNFIVDYVKKNHVNEKIKIQFI